MTSALSCSDAEIALGALVLGALDPIEREQVEAHVALCPPCAAALAEIAPLPGLLHRAELTSAELEPAPERILDRALAQIRTEESFAEQGDAEPAGTGPAATAPVVEPRAPAVVVAPVVPLRRRRLPLLAAAAVAVLALVVGGAWWSSHDHQGSLTASGSSDSGVTAAVVMTPTDEGTTLDLTLSGVTPGEHCSLVVVAPDGRTEVASTWVANYEGEATITGSTWFSPAEIERFEITTPDGTTLLAMSVPP